MSLFAGGGGYQSLGESARFHKVLQGQEIFGYKTPYNGGDATLPQLSAMRNHHLPEMRRCIANPNSCLLAGSGGNARVPPGNTDIYYESTGFGESVRFHKVLQGQEIVPVLPSYRGFGVKGLQELDGSKIFEPYNAGRCPAPPLQGYCTYIQPCTSAAQVSSPSSVLMFQQATSQLPSTHSLYDSSEREKADDCSLFTQFPPSEAARLHHSSSTMAFNENVTNFTVPVQKNIIHGGGGSGCRLFGFSLTEEIPVANVVGSSLSEAPSLIETSIKSPFSNQRPQMSTKNGGHGCTRVCFFFGDYRNLQLFSSLLT
ncbi:Auxin response factor 15 [Platanthera guangdongensis]|uniref:Auxin response factor 15 n=1 Tax=Platanthera guangdongensis TaxID=2320717 RepID=A0ABR2MWS0_9ASPA